MNVLQDKIVEAQPPKVSNPKHRRLADVFLRTGSKAEAARAAGYSSKTASIQGSQILKLPDVAAYVEYMQSKAVEEAGFSTDRLVKELSQIAFSNVQDYTRLNDDGDLEVDFSAASRDQLSAVSAVKVKKRKIYNNKGEVVGEEHESEFKLWDKLRAGELLGKQHGMFKQDDQRVVVDVADRLLNARARTRAGGLAAIEDMSGGEQGSEDT